MSVYILKPTTQQLIDNTLDITAPALGVEIDVRDDGQVAWINVDGVCVLRLSRFPQLIVTDRRFYPKPPKAKKEKKRKREEEVPTPVTLLGEYNECLTKLQSLKDDGVKLRRLSRRAVNYIAEHFPRYKRKLTPLDLVIIAPHIFKMPMTKEPITLVNGQDKFDPVGTYGKIRLA